jgi:VanZ family protein
MVFTNNRPAVRVVLRAPVIVMVLAATAIPIELRPLGHTTLSLDINDWPDIVENIAGYMPVGIVLGGLGPLRAVLAAALISMFAEVSQLVMVHRDPSIVDVCANVIGAALGAVITAHWKVLSAGLPISAWKALIATTMAFVVLVGIWAQSGDALNTRGATSPGTLEAYWKFDESSGGVAVDSSGRGLDGKFHSQAKRTAGVRKGAIKLNGPTDFINFGHSSAFRLVGSMTISAWIKSASFPADDAAIVSNHNRLGYQLDTTVDRGPRTIGFKLADACGKLMARYGATSLVTDTWYHVAGVYDAGARTLDVYLNGKLDNGFLHGSVTGTQRSSREAVYVGRRSDGKGFEFAGSIDDVRIYSRALTQVEIGADMHGTTGNVTTKTRLFNSHSTERPRQPDAQCTELSDLEDARIPGAAALFGVLVAIACVGFQPAIRPLTCLVASFAAGLLFIPTTASTLPFPSRWLMPVISLAGGMSVARSLRRKNASTSSMGRA